MSLTDAEKVWVSRATGRFPDAQAFGDEVARTAANAQARDQNLEKTKEYLDNVRAELAAAHEGLGIMSGKKATPVLAADAEGIRADAEVETRDVRGEDQLVGPDGEILAKGPEQREAVMRLQNAHKRLVEIQDDMLSATGPDGSPLFSEDDVRRELWNPLMREGVIPENSISDRFSEQAIAFSGAVDLYQDQIAAYSKEHTRAGDNARMVASLIKEGASLASSLGQGIVALKESGDLAQDAGETMDLRWKVLRGEASQSEQDRLTVLTSDNKELAADIARQQNAIAAISTFVVLGVDAVETGATWVLSDDLDRSSKAARAAFDTLMALAPAVVDVVHNERTSSSASRADKKAADTEAAYIKLAIKAGFQSAQVLGRLNAARVAPTEKAALAELSGAINAVADAVATGFAAGAKKISDSDLAASETRRGAQISSLIKASGKAVDLLNAYRNGNGKEMAVILGAGGLIAGMSFGSDGASAGLLEQGVDADSSGGVLKAAAFDRMTALELDKIADGTQEFVASGDSTDPALEAEMAAEVRAEQMQAAEEALANLNSPETVAEIQSDVAAELLGVQELYSTALPDLTAADPAEIAAAQAALDKAMGQGAELETALKLVDMVVSGGLSVVASVYPGASIAIAGKKMVKDFIVLSQKCAIHNDWCDVLITAMAGQGGAAAAIENAMHNAKVHRSKARIEAGFSVLKVGTSVLSSVDPSGIGLAVSGAVTIAQAVTSAVEKLHGWNEVRRGWNAYKTALDDPANRRTARAALRLNSTLAKCCVGYGAAMLNDPAAKQAMQLSGLSIAAIQNDKDICVRLVAYLQKELSDDDDVLRVVTTTDRNWFPGQPELTLRGWRRFVKAAESAMPPLHATSKDTPAIDRILSEYESNGAWTTVAEFPAPDADDFDLDAVTGAQDTAENAESILARLELAFKAYRPMQGGTADAPGALNRHETMEIAGGAFATLCVWNKNRATADIADLASLASDAPLVI